MAVASKVAVAQVISEDENDIWPGTGFWFFVLGWAVAAESASEVSANASRSATVFFILILICQAQAQRADLIPAKGTCRGEA